MKCNKCNGEWMPPAGCSFSKCPFCGEALALSPKRDESVPYEVLRGIVEDFGIDVLKENRLSGLIGDLMFGDSKIKQLFKFAATKQIGTKLLSLKNLGQSDRTIQIANIKLAFCEDNFLQESVAYYVVDSFVYALGWIEKKPDMGNLSLQKKSEATLTKMIDESNEYPEPVCERGFYAYQYKNGEMATAYIYEYANPFSDSLALVIYKNKWAFINREGCIVISSNEYIYIEPFSDGLALVRKRNKKIGFIDTFGKEVIPVIYDDADSFNEGLSYVRLGNSYYFVNKDGNEVFPKIYDNVDRTISEELVCVNIGIVKEKYGFINKLGREVIPLIYDYARSFSEGLALVKLNGKYGFINKEGKEIIPSKYDKAESFSEGLTCVRLNEKYGFIDKVGREIIPCRYDEAKSFSEGLACVKLNEKYGFIDKKGYAKIPCKYYYADFFREGLACVRLSRKFDFIDKTGKEVIPCRYDSVSSFSEGLALVKLNEKYGFINKAGKEIIPCMYDDCRYPSCGLIRVKLDGKYGFINTTGKVLISIIYDHAAYFYKGLAAVSLHGQKYYIDRMGNFVSL